MAEEDESTGRGAGKLGGFLQLLRQMEECQEEERPLSGTIEGPFFSLAEYGGKVRIGMEKAFRRSVRIRRD
jgi:hypothetical protein